MKKFIMPALTLGVVLCFALPVKSVSEKPKRGGTLTVAIRKDIALMNPLVATRSGDKRIRALMYDSLLNTDLKGNIQPNLARSWEVSDSGRLITFKLRKDVKFHNGQGMTAEDVKFAMDYTMNPKNGASGITRLTSVDRVEVADKHTLKVFLKTSSLAILPNFSDISAFSVIPKESLVEGISRATEFPPGTGPFRFVEWKPKQRIVLERFDDHWGQKAYIDKLVLRPIRDGTVRFTALRAGDVDLVEEAPYEWIQQLVKGKLKGIEYVDDPAGRFWRLVFNVAAAPFRNKNLRQAVMYAVDKKELEEAASFGFGESADQKYPKGHKWYFQGVSSPSFNLGKARALIKESGYKGEPIELLVNPGTSETHGIILQAQLRRIGMNIKIDLVEYGAYVQRWRTGKFAFKFSGGSSDPDPWSEYSGSLMCEGTPSRRASNESGYCKKEMDALFNRAESELDSKKRRRLFKKILTLWNEDMPDMPLSFVPRFFAFRDYVKGFTTNVGAAAMRWSGGGLNHTWLER